MMANINILNDFSEYPGLRHCSLSDKSGEDFYHSILNDAFKLSYQENTKLIVNLDNTGGYASSFLDEAFGNLVYDFSLKMVKQVLEIISLQEPEWKDMIQNKTFNEWEQRRKDRLAPKVTEVHNAWFRLVNDNLEHKVWELPV